MSSPQSARLGFGALIVLLPLLGTGSAKAEITTLYVIQHAHADVGFDAPPAAMFQRNHDRTLAALDLADLYPEFRWTIETSYQLEGFLANATEQNLNRLKTCLAAGRFTFGANYTNLHSGLCGERELNLLLEPGRRMAAQLGTTPTTAMLNDVPGFTLAMPRVLSAGAVPYAILGANDFIGGKPNIPLAHRPFWWQARDGSRTLTWLTFGSYIEGYFDWGLTGLTNARTKVLARLAEFEAAGYPYDAVMVLRAADDEFPNQVMPELARDWNNTYTDIVIKLATPAEFFAHMLDTYGEDLPLYEGDASGMWESVAMVTPVSTSRVRRARTRLVDLERLWEIISTSGGPAYPVNRFLEAWKLAQIFDEHSGGGFGWPGLLSKEEIEQENRQFVWIAAHCEELTAALEDDALALAGPALVPPGTASLVLLNPAAAGNEGFVEVQSEDVLPQDLRLIDVNSGVSLAYRWMDDNRKSIAFETEIPGESTRRWRIAGNGDTPDPPQWNAGVRLTAGIFELVLDPALGTATQLIDHETGIDWLEQPGPHRFRGIEWGTNLEAFFGTWREGNPSGVSVQIEEPSAIVRRARVFDRRNQLLCEYRLHENERRLDVDLRVRRSTLPFVPYDDHSHHYCISFPANLLPPTVLLVDGPDGWFRPGEESLPGAALGHFASSTGARLVDSRGRWMSMSSVDSPMLDLGEMDESALPAVETDEQGLAWKIIRHADLAEVRGGDHVPIEAEPGVPDELRYRFVVRFGDGSELPPDRAVLQRDLSPPLATWVDRR